LLSIAAESGSIEVARQPAELRRDYRLSAESGAFAFTGYATVHLPIVTCVSINSAYDSSATAVVQVPSHAAGDLLVAAIMWRSNRGSLTVPSGWSLQGTYLTSIEFTGSFSQPVLLYTKTASASEPSSYTWTASNASGKCWLSASVRGGSIEGVDTNYGNGTTATISTTASRLNLTVFSWLYASNPETYSQSGTGLTEITDSPGAGSRISGGYTTQVTTVTSTHSATTTLYSPNHGGINIRFV
jgi:hypothetical protein